jgi:hypothetical protein
MREPGFYWVRLSVGDCPVTIAELRRGKPGWEEWSAMGCDTDHCEEDVVVLSERLVPPEEKG